MQKNRVLFYHEVAEKVRAIRNCPFYEFQKAVQETFGSVQINATGTYLGDGDKYRTCTASEISVETPRLVIGFTKENGEVTVRRVTVECSISDLLVSDTFSKVVHVSHDDLDGESPLILSRIAFSDKALITRACSYDKVDEIVMDLIENEVDKENTIMFITDISVQPENLKKIHELNEEGYRIFMIDHHDAKEGVPVEKYSHWMKLDQVYPDGRGTAATGMYYDFLVEHGFLQRTAIMDDYVELVRLYDTWEWDDETDDVWQMERNVRAKRLNDFYFMGNRKEFSDETITSLTDVSQGVPALFKFDPHVEYMLDKEDARIADFVQKKSKQMKVFKGLVDGTDRVYSYGVIIAETYQSELGNYICKNNLETIDFVVMIDVGRAKMSLRSNKAKDVNVGAIARTVGGGGRAQTAGCPLNSKTMYLFLEQFLVATLVQ